jgi:FkbM family methyltransferase
MPFISFAQNFEDVILWRALRHISNGFYVDVGAADPDVDSVTRVFYDRDWSGINVEPLREHFDKLVHARPRDTNLNVAVGREAGMRTLYAFPGTGLSTLNARIAELHRGAGFAVNAGFSAYESVVPVLPLSKILEDYAPPTIHFLKIDVEGAEAEVLEGLDLKAVRPWIILVEATYPNSELDTRADWEHLLSGRGYEFAYFDGLNCFYVADEISKLKDRLAIPPNVFDEFTRRADWLNAQKAATLEEQLLEYRGVAEAASTAARNAIERADDLEVRLERERSETEDLRNALAFEKVETAVLSSSLKEKQSQVSSLLDLRVKLQEDLRSFSVARVIRRELVHLREIGNRLSGGGLRNFARRMVKRSLQSAMRQPLLNALGRAAVQPFPTISEKLYHLGKEPGSEVEPILPATPNVPIDVDRLVSVSALYRAAFGRFPDRVGLADSMKNLRAGVSLESLAEILVGSEEFQTRHGSSENVDIEYICALYRNGLGRVPGAEDLTAWLGEAAKGLTRARVLAGVARSPEAIACALVAVEEFRNKKGFRSNILETRARVSFLVANVDHEDGLRPTLDSIRAQSESQWEVVVGLAPGEAELLSRNSQKLGLEDDRLLLTTINSGSKASTLTDLFSLSKGEYIAVLDPGDVLSASALSEIADAMWNHPDADIFYSDEDILSASGAPVRPYLKPEWSPEILFAFNYFGRLTVIRREIVAKSGGFDANMGAAVEWDLNLRVTESSPHIVRIPKLLCHRSALSDRDRPSPESSAASVNRKAIQKFWGERGIQARVETQPDGTQRSVWDIAEPPVVSIIIPNKNKCDLLRTCMDGIIGKTDYVQKEVIIVDNRSDDPETFALYRELELHPWIKVVRFDKAFNYSAICNYGASFAEGRLLLFLNNDVEVISSDWLTELVRYAMRPGVGIVGTKLIYPNRVLQHAGVVLGIHLTGLIFRNAPINEWGVFGSPNHPRNYLAIMGACQLVRREVFARVGGFDESYQVANSDVALCLHAWRAGYRIAYNPFAALVHHEGASRGYHNPIRDMQRTAADIQMLGFTDDPYFHPGLSASNPAPTLRTEGDLSTRETLRRVVAEYLRAAPPTIDLDLYDDHAVQEATGLLREELLWPPQRADAIDDIWSAARYLLDLLRTRFDLRLRFPAALSGGETGEFARWIRTTGGDEYFLSEKVRNHIKTAFEERPSTRARQLLYFHEDLREQFTLGLTPIHRRGLFRWFLCQGREEEKLRLEEIWWLFLECAENPSRELVRSYWFTPEWQEARPDGLTVFGREELASWLARRYHISADWLDPEEWPVQLTPAQQIRLAYNANGDWQKTHPGALTTPEGARALLTWLRGPDAAVSEKAGEWLSNIDAPSTVAELVRPGVNIIGHFCSPSGLRTSVEAIRDALTRTGFAISTRDIRADKSDDPYHCEFSGMELYDITIVHTQPEPYFKSAFHLADLFERTQRTYRIAYWYWELDAVPETWLKHVPLIDELWAATNFVSDALKKRFGRRVHTLFPGIQLGKFQPRPLSYFGLAGKEEFTFLSIFHLMSVMERKNPLGLIRAFKQAFPASEPVRLVLKTTFGDRHPKLVEELHSAANTANITVIDKIFNQDETLSLIDACDAYISLHRSEGLGLTMAEAMLLGKPVIATRYSGNVDFMDDTNSLLVDYELVELGESIPPYDTIAHGAEPSIDHAARLMRLVFENRCWAAELGAKGKLDVQSKLSLEAAGRRMAERLTQITAERRIRTPGF